MSDQVKAAEALEDLRYIRQQIDGLFPRNTHTARFARIEEALSSAEPQAEINTCPHCEGSGAVVTVEPRCCGKYEDGSCSGECPVPEQVQSQCEFCYGMGYQDTPQPTPTPDDGQGVEIDLRTLKWWRELVDLNPQDLAPRLDARIAEITNRQTKRGGQ